MGKILEHVIEGMVHSNTLKFLIITIVSTLIVLVTAEFIPKTLFRLNPDRLLSALALPFRFFHLLLWPLIFVVKKISGVVLRIFTKTTITETTPVFTKVDLDNYISTLEHSNGVQDTDLDTEVFRNALDFREVKVRDFMVPRPELVGADINETIDALRSQFIETRLSRILIYRDNIDHIIGFVHHSEMLDFPENISQVLKPVLIVNESMQAHDLLRDFIQKRRSIAVVVDEFGGTAGIATIEDVIEEIFGEIEDEFDGEQLTEKQLDKNHYLLSARHEIYYLNEKYELGIPEGDYNTLGGFVLFICEKIPHVREVIRQGRFEFVITKAKGARVEEVELILHANED
jgi:CBS domain containing-hemolysin-like protein